MTYDVMAVLPSSIITYLVLPKTCLHHVADSQFERSRAGIAPRAWCGIPGSSVGSGIVSTGCTAQPTLSIATIGARQGLFVIRPRNQGP